MKKIAIVIIITLIFLSKNYGFFNNRNDCLEKIIHYDKSNLIFCLLEIIIKILEKKINLVITGYFRESIKVYFLI